MTTTAPVYTSDFYERLEIPRTATAEEIKRAYQRKLRLYPPERAPEEFKQIREAYETLGDPASRRDYDDRPEPQAVEWFERAVQAMRDEEYAVAEGLFKQVLLLDRDRGFVRNMLGLCLLYQGEAAKAAEQFGRLLDRPEASAAWFGNAAVAALRLEQYEKAESFYREALHRARDGDTAGYYAGLADVYVARDDHERARGLLEEAIAADGKVDFEDLRFFTKLLELGILERDLAAVRRELARIQGIAADEDQRRYLAWKLGVLAWQLVEVGGFDYSELIAALARQLQPDDNDYWALQEVSRLLGVKRFDAALEVVRSHPSFQQDGWLKGLGPKIGAYCTRNRVFAELQPIDSAPSLGTINGFGVTLYGQSDPDTATGSHVAVHWFVALFIPILPLGRYRVIETSHRSYRFLGKLPLTPALRRWRLAVLALFGLWMMWGLASEGGSRPGAALRVDNDVPTGAGVPASPFTTAPVGTNSSPAPRTALFDANNDSWYISERTAIRQLESQVTAIDDRMKVAEADIERAKRNIDAAESGYGTFEVGDADYRAAIRRHNRLIDEYNAELARRQTLYSDYKRRLDAFNAKVDAHNTAR